MVSLRIVSLLVPQGTGVCTRPAPLSGEESEGYDDCCLAHRFLDCQGGGSSSSTSTPRLCAAKLPSTFSGGGSVSNSSTPRLSSKLLCARDGETRQTPTPLSRSASTSACRTGGSVTPMQPGCVTPHARVGRRSKVCLQEASAEGLPTRRDERNVGHGRCQSLGSLGGFNRAAPRKAAPVKSPPWRGGGNSVSSKGPGMPQRAQSHTNLKSMQQQQQQTLVSGSNSRKAPDSSGSSAGKASGRSGSCPAGPCVKESRRHPAALPQRTTAKCGPAVRRPQRREASTGKAAVDTPLFRVDLWSEAGGGRTEALHTWDQGGGFCCEDSLVQAEQEFQEHETAKDGQQVQGEEETEAPSSIRRYSAAADSVVHSEVSHGVVDALHEVSADETWVRSFQSTSVRRSMPAEDDTREGRCSAATARSSYESCASGSYNTQIATALRSARPSTGSTGVLAAFLPEDDTREGRCSAATALSSYESCASGSCNAQIATGLRSARPSTGSTGALAAIPAEDDGAEERCWVVSARPSHSTSAWNMHTSTTGLQSARPSTDKIGRRNSLVAMPAEDVRFSRRSWAGAAEPKPQVLPAKEWNQDMAAVAASGGPTPSQGRTQIPYPPSGSSWEWPLSRHEKKSRVVMIDRCMLMADHSALARQLQKVRALVS